MAFLSFNAQQFKFPLPFGITLPSISIRIGSGLIESCVAIIKTDFISLNIVCICNKSSLSSTEIPANLLFDFQQIRVSNKVVPKFPECGSDRVVDRSQFIEHRTK